jgi:hypothetical protein
MLPQLEQRIRDRAYLLWEAEGRPDNRANEHWYRAIKIELGWRRIIYYLRRWDQYFILLLGLIVSILSFRYFSPDFTSQNALFVWIGAWATIILCFLTVMVPRMQADGFDYDDAEKRAWAINEYRKTFASIATGLLIIGGFFLTALQIADAFRKDVGERFTKSVEEIGSASIHTRIGGVYGFARILQDSPADQPAIIEILAAFIHQQVPTDAKSPHAAGPPPDVMAAILTISRAGGHENQATQSIDLGEVDLSEAKLHKLRLPSASLVKAHLDESDLSDAILENDDLQYAIFDGAVLTNADLRGADLLGASFRGTDLTRADLTGVKNASADKLRQAILIETLLPSDLAAELKNGKQ